MQKVSYVDEETNKKVEYYRITVDELTTRKHIDGKQIRPLHVRGVEKIKMKCQNKKFNYVQLHCSFDIETTTINEHSYMYIWQFGFINEGIQFVCKGRTWGEFETLMQTLSNMCGVKDKVLVWVHNLPFEFSFMKLRYNNYITNLFCKEKEKPIKFDFMEKVEFRDSMTLCSKSLKALAEDYCQVRKLKNDLDYSVLRNSTTNLTEQEERYCDNDVIILSQYDCYVWDNIYKYETIPLTQTGILRTDIKEGLKAEKEYKRITKWIRWNFPSETLYNLMMNYLFKGGITNANFHHVKEIIYNMDSYDLTSSYPAICLQDLYYFPSKFVATNEKDFDKLMELSKEKCVCMIVEFDELQATTEHNIISKSKCMKLENALVLNGRVRCAKKVRVFETELDLYAYKKFYTWKGNPRVIQAYVSNRMEMPDYIKKPLLKAYELKSLLKRQGKIYATEKAKVNSGYGMLVQRLIEQQFGFNSTTGEFETESITNWVRKISGKMFLPQWGVYVTAWARLNLLMGIYSNHTKIYAYDTDSIKGHFDDIAKKWLNDYNNIRIASNKRLAEKYDIDFSTVDDLGCWDCETEKHKYTRFETLGSKRYIYEQDGEFHQTVAGLGKTAMYEHCKKHYPKENTIDKCFEIFDNNMMIDEPQKLRHKLFNDVTDYVDGEKMHEYSGTVLLPTNFTMTLEKVFYKTILEYQTTLQGKEKRIL